MVKTYEGVEFSAVGTWLYATSDDDVLETCAVVLVTADDIDWAEVTIEVGETWATEEVGVTEAGGGTGDDEETVKGDGFAEKEGAADAEAGPVENGIADETVEDAVARLLATDDIKVAEDNAMGGTVELLEEWTWLLDINDTINSEKRRVISQQRN